MPKEDWNDMIVLKVDKIVTMILAKIYLGPTWPKYLSTFFYNVRSLSSSLVFILLHLFSSAFQIHG